MNRTFKNLTGAGAAGLILVVTAAGFAGSVAHADITEDQPVTFEVTAGSLALAQTPTAGTALIQGTAVAMPVTTITDGRNDFDRTGLWTVSVVATDLDEAGGASIAADQITINETGSFTSGSGTRVDEAPAVGEGALVSATGDSIDSVYTYTPTATLAIQTLPYSGSYTGTVTQTVV